MKPRKRFLVSVNFKAKMHSCSAYRKQTNKHKQILRAATNVLITEPPPISAGDDIANASWKCVCVCVCVSVSSCVYLCLCVSMLVSSCKDSGETHGRPPYM